MGADPIDRDEAVSAPATHLFAAQRHPIGASITARRARYTAATPTQSVELLIDNFDTAAEGKACMRSPAFAKNPIGIEFNPHVRVAHFRSGANIKELVLVER